MTPSDLRWNLTPWLLLLCQITYFLMFSWLMLLWVIEKEFLSRNSIFDLKWPRCNILWRNTFFTQAYRSTKRLKEKNSFSTFLYKLHAPQNLTLHVENLHFLKISRIRNFFFNIIFRGALSPGGVRFPISPMWSFGLPPNFESPHYTHQHVGPYKL